VYLRDLCDHVTWCDAHGCLHGFCAPNTSLTQHHFPQVPGPSTLCNLNPAVTLIPNYFRIFRSLILCFIFLSGSSHFFLLVQFSYFFPTQWTHLWPHPPQFRGPSAVAGQQQLPRVHGHRGHGVASGHANGRTEGGRSVATARAPIFLFSSFGSVLHCDVGGAGVYPSPFFFGHGRLITCVRFSPPLIAFKSVT